MTTEEKAKAYDEALEGIEDYIKSLKNVNDGIWSARDIEYSLSEIFPELAESEDEKIKQWLIGYFQQYKEDGIEKYASGLKVDDILAWLEKQGEQGKQKSADKVEPKFNVGDFIVNDYCMGKVMALTDDAYLLDTGQGIPFSCEHNVHLWTIADAKDGDVLQLGLVTAIFGKYIGNGCCTCYCSVWNGEFEIPRKDSRYGCHNATPATKEQRELLFQKMKEAGYEWDAEKKELKKVEQKPTEDVDLPEFESYLCLMFQKFRTKGICTNGEIIDYVKEHSQKLRDILVNPAEWSGEDERMCQDVVNDLRFVKELISEPKYAVTVERVEKEINWFKSLKDRVQPQPKQEWSEEDEEFLRRAINAAKDTYPITTNWLKSIKDRYTWKPTDEQMDNLSRAFNGATYRTSLLRDLYLDLKKLKGD